KALLEQDRLRRHQVELLRCEEIHVEFRPDLERMKEQMEEEKFRKEKLLDAETESLVLFLRRQEEKEREERKLKERVEVREKSSKWERKETEQREREKSRREEALKKEHEALEELKVTCEKMKRQLEEEKRAVKERETAILEEMERRRDSERREMERRQGQMEKKQRRQLKEREVERENQKELERQQEEQHRKTEELLREMERKMMEKREMALREEEKWKELIQKQEEECQRRFLERRREWDEKKKIQEMEREREKARREKEKQRQLERLEEEREAEASTEEKTKEKGEKQKESPWSEEEYEREEIELIEGGEQQEGERENELEELQREVERENQKELEREQEEQHRQKEELLREMERKMMEEREIALREEEKWKELIQKQEEECQHRFLERRRERDEKKKIQEMEREREKTRREKEKQRELERLEEEREAEASTEEKTKEKGEKQKESPWSEEECERKEIDLIEGGEQQEGERENELKELLRQKEREMEEKQEELEREERETVEKEERKMAEEMEADGEKNETTPKETSYGENEREGDIGEGGTEMEEVEGKRQEEEEGQTERKERLEMERIQEAREEHMKKEMKRKKEWMKRMFGEGGIFRPQRVDEHRGSAGKRSKMPLRTGGGEEKEKPREQEPSSTPVSMNGGPLFISVRPLSSSPSPVEEDKVISPPTPDPTTAPSTEGSVRDESSSGPEEASLDHARTTKEKLNETTPDSKATSNTIMVDLKDFALQPAPRDSKVRCLVKRDTKDSDLFPTYYMYLEEDGNKKFLLSAKNRSRTMTADYAISVDPEGLDMKAENAVGKLRSNMMGTKFILCEQNGRDERAQLKDKGPKPELAVIRYESDTNEMKRPRKMSVTIPDVTVSAGTPVDSAKDQGSFFQKWQRKKKKEKQLDNTIELCSAEAVWNEAKQTYEMDFYGRTKRRSRRNFQLVNADSPDKILMLFARVDDDDFTLDYSYPLCAMHAFSIALSSIHNKLGCV
ncbi:hypothetical protein NFI96_015072, partial [Prochilodus magdalenae]